MDATIETLIPAVFVPLDMAWMTSITPKGGGKGSLFVEPPARHHDSLIPPQTPSSVLLSLATPDGLSTLSIAQLYVLCPCGKYNIGFNFSKRGPLPSYSVI